MAMSWVNPFLEGISGYYTLTDEPLARGFLTASYSLWAVPLILQALGMSLFGHKLVHILNNSVNFQLEKTSYDEKVVKRLQHSLASVSPRPPFPVSTRPGLLYSPPASFLLLL